MKWLTRGTLLAVLPFTLFYAIPFLLDLASPRLLTNLAGLSLVFLPLTFSWAIVRYRLMDTDLIFKRGVAYTLATGLIARRATSASSRSSRCWCTHAMPEAVREWGLVLAILVTAADLRSAQAREFKAGSTAPSTAIATTTARRSSISAAASAPRPISQALLESIVERLPRTLLVARVAVFLADDSGRLRLAASHGLPAEA